MSGDLRKSVHSPISSSLLLLTLEKDDVAREVCHQIILCLLCQASNAATVRFQQLVVKLDEKFPLHFGEQSARSSECMAILRPLIGVGVPSNAGVKWRLRKEVDAIAVFESRPDC